MMKAFLKKKEKEPIVDEIASVVEAVQTESAKPADTAKARTRLPLTHRTFAKVIAFLLVLVMPFTALGCVLGAIFMIDEELYTTPEWSYKYTVMQDLTEADVYTLMGFLTDDDTDEGRKLAAQYLSARNIASVVVIFPDDTGSNWGYDGGKREGSMEFSGTWYCIEYKGGLDYVYSQYTDFGDHDQAVNIAEITIRLAEELTEQDTYYFADRLISLVYALRYWVYVIGFVAVLLTVFSFVFLMCAAGRRNGSPTPQPGWDSKIPFDLLTCIAFIAGCLILILIDEAPYFHSAWKQVMVLGAGAIALWVILVCWCMSFAARVKVGALWKNTVIYHLCRLAVWLLRKLWRGVSWCFRGVAALCGGIPLVWKTALCLSAIAFIEFCVLVCAYGEFDVMLTFWLFRNFVIAPAVLYVALMLRKLQKGGKALAAGDLNYQVDTRGMVWDFKRHGEHLNSIGEGMTAAVEQRLRSERMKTELITNVSHDIKTPLTSIINYADLIEKEPCDNPTITEYAGVLHRQSDRLKRLIDDLVEASKASTGNLEILLAPCEVGVILTQAAGEYEQKLSEKELTLVTTQPEQSVKIMADGRRLWRVFDNLMNNVSKYAQRGTRVYLTLEERGGEAVISLKNISREPLNLSAEELMERFVQGDPSRQSEGNGLGLSIAKSLTELQNGTMELTTDGDLFKVVLKFPTI